MLQSTLKRSERIFLSYARADDESFVSRLYHDLTALGLDVWWDREKMPNRALTFLHEIREAIVGCDRLLLVVGPAAVSSPYVTAEWQYALSICKPVIPLLRLGEFSLLPTELQAYHCPDFRDTRDFDQAFAELTGENILGATIAPLGALYGQIPIPPPWAIPRHQSFRQLDEVIRADMLHPTVVSGKAASVLHAPGGVGKTTLAAMFSRDCNTRRAFQDGVIWIEVGKAPSIAARQADIGVIFGDNRENYKDRASGKASLQRILVDQSALIVLDDVWDYRHAEPFLVDAPRCRWLIITRTRRIATQLQLDDRHTVHLGLLTELDGMALIARRLRLPTELEYPHREIHRQIVQLLKGHTQAIAIAAARLDANEEGHDFAPALLEGLRTRLDGETPFKDLLLGDGEDREYSLEASLSLSYGDLPKDLAFRFRTLGTFAPEGTFDVAAASALWEDESDQRSQDALDELVRAALLDSIGDGRYSQHTLLRAYAHALMDQSLREQTEARLFRHYFKLYQNKGVNNRLDQQSRMPGHDTLQSDFANVHSVLEWGLSHQVEDAFTLAKALDSYLLLRESIATYQTLMNQALNAAQQVEFPAGEAYALVKLGSLSVFLDEMETAQRYFERGIELCEQIGDTHGLANALRARGEAYTLMDDLGSARTDVERAAALYEQLGDPQGLADALRGLGETYVRSDMLSNARVVYERALQLYEQIEHPLGMGATLRVLGDVAYYFASSDDDIRDEEVQKALQYYERAIHLCEQIGDQRGIANVTKRRGDLHLLLEAWSDARLQYEAATLAYEQLGDRAGVAMNLRTLGEVSMMTDDLQGARDYFERAIVLYEQIGSKLGLANTLSSLGDLLIAQELWEQCIPYYKRGLAIARAIQDQLGTANILVELGKALFESGDRLAGIENMEEAAAIFTAIGNSHWGRIAQERLIDMLERDGQTEAAQRLKENLLS
jgi:tetratricopeptide (TPR) repeat protein